MKGSLNQGDTEHRSDFEEGSDGDLPALGAGTRNAPAATAETPSIQALLGSWRVMSMNVEAPNEAIPRENMVLTFDGWTMTWLTEPDDITRYIYRPLSKDSIAFVSDDESVSATHDGTIQFTVHDDRLDLLIRNSDSTRRDGWGLQLKRITDPDQISAFASHTVSVDLSELYGWSEESVVDTHVKLVRSLARLESIQWPDGLEDLLVGAEELSEWLQQEMQVVADPNNEILIGLHGHVTTKEKRQQIVDVIADTYQTEIAKAKTDQGKKDIAELLRQHDRVVQEREIAESDHRSLLEADEPDNDRLLAIRKATSSH